MEHKQGSTMYLVSSIGNSDGSVDFEDDVPETFSTLETAVEAAQDTVREYNMRTYVYKCTPIYKVERGKMRVTKLEGKK